MSKGVKNIVLLLSCVCLFFISAYLFLLDFDFFFNQEHAIGSIRIERQDNEIVTYFRYTTEEGDSVIGNKKFKVSQLNRLNNLDTNDVEFVYGNLFRDTHIKGIRQPRMGILVLELLLILLSVKGMFLASKRNQ